MTVKVDTYGLTVQAARPGVIQNVALGAASTQSSAFVVGSVGQYAEFGSAAQVGTPVQPPTTQHVRLCSTTDCYVLFGPNPIVTALNGMLLPALSAEYFWVLPGERLAAIAVSGTGALNVTECAGQFG